MLLAPVVAVAALTLRLQGRAGAGAAGGWSAPGARSSTRPATAHAVALWLAVAPMLVNVLRGEMTLVGPRARIVRRSSPPLKPGLTGWAQLRSRVSEGADSSW